MQRRTARWPPRGSLPTCSSPSTATRTPSRPCRRRRRCGSQSSPSARNPAAGLFARGTGRQLRAARALSGRSRSACGRTFGRGVTYRPWSIVSAGEHVNGEGSRGTAQEKRPRRRASQTSSVQRDSGHLPTRMSAQMSASGPCRRAARKTIARLCSKKAGGGTGSRTRDGGFADLCLTTWLCRPGGVSQHERQTTEHLSLSSASCAERLERVKGLEPSTFCMASRRSSRLSYTRSARR